MKTLTIIVPTYNMENYIGKCLSSLIVSGKDLEVLVIIDGSEDKSSEIAKDYQAKYPDIFRVVEKENANYGSCVNVGLSLAQGEYIKVLDADDCFDSNLIFYLQFLNSLNVDVVLTDYVVVDGEDTILMKGEFTYNPKIELSIDDLTTSSMSLMEHYALTYRTELLRGMSYKQTEGISYTDLQWSSLPFSVVETFAYYPDVIYRYFRGRKGQTIDIDYRRNNMWMENSVDLDLAKRYEQIKDDLGPSNRAVVKEIISNKITQVYRHYLLDYHRQLKEAELVTFDENLHNTSEELYRQVEKAVDVRKFGTFHYVRDFRKNLTRNGLKYFYYDILRGAGEQFRNIKG